MIRGVIQVRCRGLAGARRRSRSRRRSRGRRSRCSGPDASAARRCSTCEILEQQHRAVRRRPPFQRRDMRERIKPVPVGGEQGRQREVVHNAGKARRIGERALRIGQSVVGGEQFVRSKAAPDSAGRPCASALAPRPGPAPSARPYRRALAKQRGAAVGRRRRGKRHMIGVVGQTRSPNVWKWRNSSPLSLTAGLMEGYLNMSKSGLVNRSLTPP